MKGLLGLKLGMSQIFSEDGVVTPVTIIQAGPCYVTQIKDVDSDGYTSVQLGFGDVKERRLSNGQKGHLGLLPVDEEHPQRKANNNIPALRHLREFRTTKISEYKVGQLLTVEQFEVGGRVDVSGVTKGKGFAGVVKRYGFGGGMKTHGQSDRWRAPGSVGATSGTAHVFKGKKMPGRMGGKRYTSQNLEIMRVDVERNLIALKGAVPGHKGSFVVIRDVAKS
jgi:large subunit ribosomal protein L3